MNPDADNNSLPTTNLPADLVERILARLGFARQPEPKLTDLRTLYGAWCQRVPFDNVRKLIHVRAGDEGLLPGSTATDFFEAWLKFGTGGTCWSGAGACHALLTALGFHASRGIATMLVAPGLPPNHGSVLVRFGPAQYLVDCSILHGEPLRLEENMATSVRHPAWGVNCRPQEGRWHVAWRPLHKLDGFDCRFERFGAEPGEFQKFYAQTRGWSPFNYQVTARLNRGEQVVGLAFGQAVSLRSDGSVLSEPVAHDERMRSLIEEIGMSEEIVRQLPQDIPTPPPPGSHTAQTSGIAVT